MHLTKKQLRVLRKANRLGILSKPHPARAYIVEKLVQKELLREIWSGYMITKKGEKEVILRKEKR